MNPPVDEVWGDHEWAMHDGSDTFTLYRIDGDYYGDPEDPGPSDSYIYVDHLFELGNEFVPPYPGPFGF